MQNCIQCAQPFSWLQIYKSFWGWIGYQPILCEKCGTKHKLKFSSRFVFAGLTTLPMILYILFHMNFLVSIPQVYDFILAIIIGIAILLLGSLLVPYVVSYRKA